MRVRFSFDVEVPGHVTAYTLEAAGRAAVLATENTIERTLEEGPKPHAATGGTCRITLKANDEGCPF